jgi:hypothetical protein
LFVGAIAALVATTSGCAWYFPHSLVAADRPLGPGLEVGARMHETACRVHVLGLPLFGAEPKIDVVMDMLYAEAHHPVGFRSIRLDESWVGYVLWHERCLDVSAEPLYAAQPGQGSEAAPTPPAAAPAPLPGGQSPGGSKDQINRWLDPPKTPGQ